MPPLVSVILPVHNGQRTLKETIDSVLRQSFRDFELIVVDDASTDSSIDIINSFQDPRIKYLYRVNKNVACSRNQGIKEAQGKYISFIDADDLWTEDKIEEQVLALEAEPQAGVVYSWTEFFDDCKRYPGSQIDYQGKVYDNLILENFIASGSNILVKKEALDTIHGYDIELLSCADWDLYLRLAAKYSYVVVKKYQILYRLSSNSMSSNLERIKKYSNLVLDKAIPYTTLPENKVRAFNLLATANIMVARLEETKLALDTLTVLLEALRLYPQLLLINRNTLRCLVKPLSLIILTPKLYLLLKDFQFQNVHS